MLALKSHINVTVSASAGSGKTYLLVSRIICLLLDGSAPNSIVAITFTRKAAGEMAERLNERLYELASIDEQQLIDKLQALDLDSSYSERARLLYETLLLNPQSVKITTFHAFCHDLLQRFPLEANINPGFELLESSTLLKHQAWQRLLNGARKKSSNNLNTALDHLFNECSNPNSVEELLLNDFLEHRSDWWAFTENQRDPVAYATRKIRDVLQLETQSYETLSLSDSLREQLKQFSLLLEKNKNKTNSGFALTLNTLLTHMQFDIDKLQTLHAIFFTTDKNPTLRKRNPSKAQAKRMGETNEDTFITLHHSLSQTVADLLDRLYREKTAMISHAWYTVGNQLLTFFQTIKHEQNCLDFSDLEWQVYKLLSNSEQSHWVQYKLDQRIDHILIDEFQDTNPTQWQMLYPLLEEITGQTERQRSVFIVGDGKQSIYRFRRAAPDLFIAAQSWLEKQPAPHHALRLDQSRRSSPAIINLVNQVFSGARTEGTTPEGSLAIKGKKLVDFQAHDTVHQDLWGHTELLPLIANEIPEEKEVSGQSNIDHTLRNPLVTPREVDIDERYQQEGQLIAQKISALIKNNTAITDNGIARAIDYGDIMILVKKRRHVADYENALLAADIPFIGTQRKSLLSTLEIQDMLSLCNTLLTPHSNLALAVVLRSPIFACSDKDLSTLAAASNDKTLSWYARLALLEQPSTTLARACTLLTQWHTLTGKLPVHDLLDRIYHQGNIIARYMASLPPHYVAKVKANLTRFIELALEIDSGRYPSLQKFIYRLELLQKRKESPDELLLSGNKQAVKLLTIHSAKGLEAPVVFIADTGNQASRNQRHHSLIDWPANKQQPDYFFLSSMYRDSISKRLIESDKQKESVEDANLLYVAMTRARQLLFISAVEPKKGDWKNSWYGHIAQQVAQQSNSEFDTSRGWSAETGTQAAPMNKGNPGIVESLTLSSSNQTTEQWHDYTPIAIQDSVSPSQEEEHATAPDVQESLDTDAIIYGNTTHRLLELLSSDRLHASSTADEVIRQLRGLPHGFDITTCWQDALAVYTAAELQACFDATHYQNAYNEVNVNAIDSQGQQRFGVIDRLVVDDKSALIIDYKSRQHLPDDLEQLAQEHREQLSRYRAAVKLLWPDKTVSAAILFTTQKKLVKLTF